MKPIKPHLSPELRAQITPHTRRDTKYAFAGLFFLMLSGLLTYNLWAKRSDLRLNNKSVATFTQSRSISDAVNTAEPKEILGVQTSERAPDQNQPSENQFTGYTVKAGDTLFNISQKYNIKWDLIAQVNNLSEPYVLHTGQSIKIPQDTTSKVPNKIYTVGSGESLSAIAQKFNVTSDDIIAVNPNLQKSDLVTPGQVIKLP
jgi:LysM repeat protein